MGKLEPTQALQKFLIDVNESLTEGKYLSYHRNGMFQTKKTTELWAVNEGSNLECISLPHTHYFGHVKLPGINRFLVFTGDNKTNSEIGIADLENCSYTRVVNNSCLNFRKFHNPITGVVRLTQEAEEEIYFIDGNNPDRIINLDKLPYKYVIDGLSQCQVKEYSNDLDCNALKLNPEIVTPELSIEGASGGNLPNGVYSVHISYLIGEKRFTDIITSSLPVQLHHISGLNALALNLTNLDRLFDRYQIILTGVVNGITTHKIIGDYPTSQSYVFISDWQNPEYRSGISATEIINRKAIYDNSGIIANNAETLIRADIQKAPVYNYQPQAFNIRAEYIVKQVPLDYYKTGGQDIGYFRNEIYRFKIRWVKTNGEKGFDSHIRTSPKTFDLNIATGPDKFETGPVYNYQIYNTAGRFNRRDLGNNVIGFGETGFWQSTEKYPDDLDIYGEQACTFISDHMMPDEEKVPRYSIIDGVIYINILGVRFLNIEHPKDQDGNYIPDISHYEIVRADRDFNNSRIVARGVVTNMGGYTNNQNKPILYSNFPYNDVSPNKFLSKKQTYKKGGVERNFQPLDTFYEDKLTFYSSFGNYFGRESLKNTYLNVEAIETGTVNGYFEEPYNHPRQKLLTNFSFYTALVLGALESYILLTGNKKVTKNQSIADRGGAAIGAPLVGPNNTLGLSIYPTTITSFEENFLSLPRWADDIKNTPPAQLPIRILINTLKTILSLGGFVFSTAEFAENALTIIKNFSSYVQYARQFNSECLYNSSTRAAKGSKRRKLKSQPFYLNNGIHTQGEFRINNGGRNSAIFLELEEGLDFLSGDTSRKTMKDYGLKADSTSEVNSTSSVRYVSLMKNNPNQYGTLEGFIPVLISTPIEVLLELNNNLAIPYESPILFGGDCIIAEETHLNKAPLFRQKLSNANFPDGVPYDYKLYNNIAYPRYWLDSTDYNLGAIVNIFGKSKPTEAKLPNQKYNLDLSNNTKREWIETDQVFYTSINGVIRYITEVPYNISFRESTDEGENPSIYQKHYSEESTDLSFIFRDDLMVKPESFKLDPSFKYLSQQYTLANHLSKIPKIPEREANTVLYSLPASSDINKVNTEGWRFFLPLNNFTFDRRDFGNLTGIHALNQDQLVFLFSNASPYVLPGRSVLKLENQNVVIGDGGLFAQAPREMMHTDIAYGSNQDKYAFRNTQFGAPYVSERQGKIFVFADKLTEISREGWQKWAAEFIPLQLTKQFPKWKGNHNPLNGVGYQIGFDNIYETFYFCKRDFVASSAVQLDEDTQEFKANGIPVEVGDPNWFYDCSLTLSYNPGLQGFQSFHDWHPQDILQEDRHFSTVKNQKIWKHNRRIDSFGNFYGVDYPYQLAMTKSTGAEATLLYSIDYIQEAYIYKTSELDRYLVKDNTFDWAMVYNNEQHSGLLKLIDGGNIRYQQSEFPKIINPHHIEIPYNKVENHHRFNMFFDMVPNKGSGKQLFITKKNGYDKIINTPALDLFLQRPPRFRSFYHTVWFAKEKAGSVQYLTKIINFNLQGSFR